MAQIHFQFDKRDEYFTPAYAVYPIMKRLKPGAVIWCPFDTADSAYVKVFSRNGFQVIYGHIQTGQDFFQVDVPDCDYIISNPPYSLKNQVLERLYTIEKPFAMLINFQGIFDSQQRFRMFKEALIKAGKGEVSSQKRRKCQGKERIEGRNPWNSYTSQLKGRKSPMRVGVNRPLWQAYTDLRWRRARVIG